MNLFEHETTIEVYDMHYRLHELVNAMFKQGLDSDAERDYRESRRLYEEAWTCLATGVHSGELDGLHWKSGHLDRYVVRSLRGNWLELHTFDEYGALSTAYINSAKDFMNKADEDGVTVHILRIGRAS